METSYQVLLSMTVPASGDDTSGLGSGAVSYSQGSLNCFDRTDPGNTIYFSSPNDMYSAATRFCQDRMDDKLKWVAAAEGEPANPQTVYAHDDDTGVRIGSSYKPDPGCPTLDFGRPDALSLCTGQLFIVINHCKRADSQIFPGC